MSYLGLAIAPYPVCLSVVYTSVFCSIGLLLAIFVPQCLLLLAPNFLLLRIVLSKLGNGGTRRRRTQSLTVGCLAYRLW